MLDVVGIAVLVVCRILVVVNFLVVVGFGGGDGCTSSTATAYEPRMATPLRRRKLRCISALSDGNLLRIVYYKLSLDIIHLLHPYLYIYTDFYVTSHLRLNL